MTIHSSSQRALSKPQTLKRVEQCPAEPQDTRSEKSRYQRTSRLNNNRATEMPMKNTATIPYNGTGSETETAKIRSPQDAKPVNAAEHTDKLPSVRK